jgi:shikimate kinase
MNSPENIILCGFMGTGKTTVGRLVAAQLGWQFEDLDHIIETRQGKPIREIFAEQGEAAFRRLEADLCAELVNWRQHVIATGGGAVVDPANRASLQRAGLVICLDAPAEEIVARLAGMPAGVTDRPMLSGADPVQRVRELLAKRSGAYNAIPYHIDTAGCSPEGTAEAIIALWREAQMKR